MFLVLSICVVFIDLWNSGIKKSVGKCKWSPDLFPYSFLAVTVVEPLLYVYTQYKSNQKIIKLIELVTRYLNTVFSCILRLISIRLYKVIPIIMYTCL